MGLVLVAGASASAVAPTGLIPPAPISGISYPTVGSLHGLLLRRLHAPLRIDLHPLDLAAARRQRQFCLVPMTRFFKPCWEAGKAVRWSIHRQDKDPFTVAAIWDSWTDRATDEIVESFSMLTINADGHPVMGRFHRPGDEKRSLVVVPQQAWGEWLNATPHSAGQLLAPMPEAEYTAASTEPRPAQSVLI